MQGVFDIPLSSSTPQQPQTQMPLHDLTGASDKPIERINPNMSETEIKSQIDKLVSQWEMGINEKKNLLFLLKTLPEIWPSDTLEQASMQDLVQNKASVRTFYKRAMRELHPDKNKNKNFKTQYLASCLYQVLNEANSVYQE